MARVDHKKIKQLIAQKQKTITDHQLFTFRAMAAHFEDMAAAQTKRYGYRRRVKVKIVWKPKDPSTAHTDSNRVWINAGHPSVTSYKSRQERYEQICGLFAHELGHALYTDFLTSQTYHSRQETGKWYPETPPLRTSAERFAEVDIRDYAQSDPKHQALLRVASHEILNVLEDGYVEQRMISEYPGVLGSCLQARRTDCFALLPTVTQMMEDEAEGEHIWQTILQNILSYMKWGRIKYGETPLSDPRIQVVFSMLGELDQALVSTDFKDRCRTANLILIRCWPDIRDFMERCEEQASAMAAAGAASGTAAEDLVKAAASVLDGSSTEGSGDSTPVSSTTPPSGGAPTAKSRAATAILAEEAMQTEEKDSEEVPAPAETDEKEEAEENSAPSGTEESGEAVEEPESISLPETDGGSDSESPFPAEDFGGEEAPDFHQTVASTETGRIPLEDTDVVSAPEGGGLEVDDEYAGTGYSGAASDIARVLETMAEDTVCAELEPQERQVVILYLEGERPCRKQQDHFRSALEKLREFYLDQMVFC